MYVGVMSIKHPEAVPELMSYVVAIIRASEDYAGLAWVRYDAAYRQLMKTEHGQELTLPSSRYALLERHKGVTCAWPLPMLQLGFRRGSRSSNKGKGSGVSHGSLCAHRRAECNGLPSTGTPPTES